MECVGHIQMLSVLEAIKAKGGVAIKSSFEDEGQTPSNLAKLNMACAATGLERYLKIGGCEAKTDIALANAAGATAIVAPMVETGYAASKFSKCPVGGERGITIETTTAIANIHEIIDGCDGLDFIVIGRCDLLGSMGLDRSQINSPAVFDLIAGALTRARAAKPGLRIGVGGGISVESQEFVEKLHSRGLLDFIETRHVAYPVAVSLADYGECCHLASLFETAWLGEQERELRSKCDAAHIRRTFIEGRMAKAQESAAM
jgi:4-hydroxy-2-oxoheptanedioate aldolase